MDPTGFTPKTLSSASDKRTCPSCRKQTAVRLDALLLRSILLFISVHAGLQAAEPSYPAKVISVGDLSLHIWLPHKDAGYYRGIRFDHLGMVGQATWKGHTFLSELKRPHVPDVHDHGAGTAEEFGFEVNSSYAAATSGDGFLKIGVGILQRPDADAYAWNRAYAMTHRPETSIVHDDVSITLSQESAHGGHGYRYTKRIAALQSGDGFVVEHELVNTGEKTILSDYYSHNMLSIDQRPLDNHYHLTFAARVRPHAASAGLAFDGALAARFTPAAATSTVWVMLDGLPKTEAANFIRVANDVSGVAMTVSTDAVPYRGVIYAERDTICPEFFLLLDVAPGSSRRWTTTYGFQQFDK